MSRLFCLFGLHSRQWIKIQHYIDTSFGKRRDSTIAHWRCERCGLVKRELFYASGFLDMCELNGESIATPRHGGRVIEVIDGGKK